MRLITPVVPLAGPELRIRLTFKNVTRLNEGLTETELVITFVTGKLPQFAEFDVLASTELLFLSRPYFYRVPG